MSLSAYSGVVGSRLYVQVRNFRPNSRVAVYWESVRKLTLISDATGRARGYFLVPPSVAGYCTVRADGALSKTASREYRVLPLIRLSKTSVMAGQSITARVSGFGANARVRVRIYDINGSTAYVTIGGLTTDGAGGGKGTFTVPRSTKTGDHKVLAVESTHRDDTMLNVQPAGDKVLIAAGDVACPSYSAGSTSCHMTATGNLIRGQAPDAVLMLGDAQYETGTQSNFSASYNKAWGSFKGITYAVAGGSHDFYGGGYFSTYFGSRAGAAEKNWYSFDLGAWHIIVLNSYCDNNGNCDAQRSWLASDLAAHPNACTLAAWHEPRYTSGTRHNNASNMDGFWDQLVRAGVEIILAGHEHNYERMGPIGTSDNSDSKGAVAFVVGTGGKSLETDSPSMEPLSRSYQANTFGVLRLTLHDGSADFKFLPEAGKSFTDSGTITCH
jgi:3',5'-cyclic AMP phosphodiesterase CpdA